MAAAIRAPHAGDFASGTVAQIIVGSPFGAVGDDTLKEDRLIVGTSNLKDARSPPSVEMQLSELPDC